MNRSLRVSRVGWLCGMLTVAGVTSARAQASAAASESATASILDVLAHQRAVQWASSVPLIRCAPAPLVEQPGAAARESRPAVLPLETAFLDAQSVKHMMVARANQLQGDR
jgi:hypothetical protein